MFDSSLRAAAVSRRSNLLLADAEIASQETLPRNLRRGVIPTLTLSSAKGKGRNLCANQQRYRAGVEIPRREKMLLGMTRPGACAFMHAAGGMDFSQ